MAILLLQSRFSNLAWRIPGTAEPGGLLSMGSHRVRNEWSDLAAAASSLISHSCPQYSLIVSDPWNFSCIPSVNLYPPLPLPLSLDPSAKELSILFISKKFCLLLLFSKKKSSFLFYNLLFTSCCWLWDDSSFSLLRGKIRSLISGLFLFLF